MDRGPNLPCHFLELPLHLRRRVYHHLGMPKNQLIRLSEWSSNRYSIPTNAFRTCRIIYEELCDELYGNNDIVIARHEYSPRALKWLRRLTPAAVSHMRCLIVAINQCTCPDICCFDGTKGVCSFGLPSISHTAPLDQNVRADTRVISGWKKSWPRLAAAIVPDRLSILLVCDCLDVETAKAVVNPLLSFPKLKDCKIRLARHHDLSIQSLALDTVNHLTRRSPRKIEPIGCFRFFNLPYEIQMKIMEYACCRNTITIPLDVHPKVGECCQPRCYAGDDSNLSYAMSSTEWRRCYCERVHSAAGNGECMCTMTRFPLPILLASRRLHDLARSFFYGGNSFEFEAEEPTAASLQRTGALMITDMSEGIPQATAFHQFSPSLIPYITKLILNYPWISTFVTWRDSSHVRQVWQEPFDILSEYANLRALNLELKLQEDWFGEAFRLDIARKRLRRLCSSYEEEMCEAYEEMLAPCVELGRRGLKGFVLYLNWLKRSQFSDGTDETNLSAADERWELETELEELVMGPTWDAVAMGVKELC